MSTKLYGAIRLGAAALSALALGACNDSEHLTMAELVDARSNTPSLSKFPKVANWSVTPSLVKNVLPGVKVYNIISSDDVLPGSPNYIFGGSADGAALARGRGNGTFSLIINHEDNFSVSRVELDKNLKPISGEYLINSDIGRFRLCSATLATPQEHGFGPVFLTAGESSIESLSHALDPYGPVGNDKLLPALGHWNAENLVPLPKQAYPGKTVIIIGDDDSGNLGGQVALYVSEKVGDLDNGKLYALAPDTGRIKESSMTVGKRYPVVFRQIAGQTTMTGAQIDAKATELGAIQFGRVEDLDYRKGGNDDSGRDNDDHGPRFNRGNSSSGHLDFGGNGRDDRGGRDDHDDKGKGHDDHDDRGNGHNDDHGRGNDRDDDRGAKGSGAEIYFIVTGQDYTGPNADKSRSKYGRVYRLVLDERTPLKGTLEVVLDGDDRTGPAKTFQNPDGIMVTDNFIYIGEDPNGYGDETHDAYLYQYDIRRRQLKVVTELDHHRDAPDAAKFNVGGRSRFGSWEYGAVLDVTDMVGSTDGGTTLMVAVQPHTWTDVKYRAPDGGATRASEQQASAVILLTGLPK